MSPTALAPTYSNPDEPPKHQVGSVADLGIPSSSYSDEIEEGRSNTDYIDNFDHLVTSSKLDSNDKNKTPGNPYLSILRLSRVETPLISLHLKLDQSTKSRPDNRLPLKSRRPSRRIHPQGEANEPI
jgi:hypothetical protein